VNSTIKGVKILNFTPGFNQWTQSKVCGWVGSFLTTQVQLKKPGKELNSLELLEPILRKALERPF